MSCFPVAVGVLMPTRRCGSGLALEILQTPVVRGLACALSVGWHQDTFAERHFLTFGNVNSMSQNSDLRPGDPQIRGPSDPNGPFQAIVWTWFTWMPFGTVTTPAPLSHVKSAIYEMLPGAFGLPRCLTRNRSGLTVQKT